MKSLSGLYAAYLSVSSWMTGHQRGRDAGTAAHSDTNGLGRSMALLLCLRLQADVAKVFHRDLAARVQVTVVHNHLRRGWARGCASEKKRRR